MAHRNNGNQSPSLNLRRVAFLVADPSENYRAIIRSILFGFGAEKVEEAAGMAQAEAMLQRNSIDFLIASYDLPGGGGVQLVNAIRGNRDHPLRSIPIVVSMSAARRMDVAGARDAGANFVIVKPIAPQTLFDRLSWIAHHPRPYWDSATYYGPDRRFRTQASKRTPRRRSSDAVDQMESQLFEGVE